MEELLICRKNNKLYLISTICKNHRGFNWYSKKKYISSFNIRTKRNYFSRRFIPVRNAGFNLYCNRDYISDIDLKDISEKLYKNKFRSL